MTATRANPGLLIAVEGIDGAGKTTQVDLLASFFASAGEPVVRSKEPTDGAWGQRIRISAANGRMSWERELHALIEDRREHVHNVITPALQQGATVILDRYFYSTIAYQGSRSGQSSQIESAMLSEFPIPDAVLLIDVLPEVGRERITGGRGEAPNTFEDLGNLRAVRAAFLELASRHSNVTRFDGLPDVGTVRDQIVRHLLFGVLRDRHCAKAYGCDEPLLCAERRSGSCRWSNMGIKAGVLAAPPMPTTSQLR